MYLCILEMCFPNHVLRYCSQVLSGCPLVPCFYPRKAITLITPQPFSAKHNKLSVELNEKSISSSALTFLEIYYYA